MKSIVLPFLLLLISAPLSAQENRSSVSGANTELIQVSTINALIQGVYDGEVTLGALRKLGNFGIGTFNELDGEMVTLDGQVYQATADGKVNRMPDTTLTPFASMTNFIPDNVFQVSKITSFTLLQNALDEKLPSKNLFYAIKITGDFRHIKARSVESQKKPYRKLTEVVKEQGVFDFHRTSGTLVGFRCPEYVQGVNVAGYHMHFISADKTQGGHVLDVDLFNAAVEIDHLTNFRMMLPLQKEFLNVDISDKGEDAINKVEKLSK